MKLPDLFRTTAILATICTLPLSIYFPFQGEDEKDSDTHPVMFELSDAIIGVQKAWSGGDNEEILPYAEAMEKATGEMLTLEPQINRNIMEVFDEYRITIGNLASELASLAEAKSFGRVPHVVEEIRHTCVSCHVMFRAPQSEYDLFPSNGNVITGEIEIVKLDGGERVDRSNALVFIDHVNSDTRPSVLRESPSISQKDRKFEPRVLPIVKGTTVEFPNDDLIFHNVFSLSKSKPFDLDVYRPGTSKYVTFDEPGWVKVYCNIHPQMVAHILVLDNSRFSLTNREGLFVISGIPDGEYTLRVWHEFGSDIRTKIHLSGSLLYRASFVIQEDKKFVQHKNKFGKPYRGKYE